MGKTSSAVKARYNQKTYKQYRFNLRKDDPLVEKLEKYQEENPQSFSSLIKKLLEEYFDA